MLYTKAHTPVDFPAAYPRGFRVPVDAMYRCHRKCHVYSSNNL